MADPIPDPPGYKREPQVIPSPPGYDDDKARLKPIDMGDLLAKAESHGVESVDRWTTSRILNAATQMAATGRSIGDINEATARFLAKHAGAGEKWQNYIGAATRLISTLPFAGLTYLPTGEEHKEAVKNVTGFQEQGAKDVAGIKGSGQVIDKATEAGIASLLTPTGSGQSIVRNIAPSVVGGATSEAIGGLEGIKNTPFEIPGRILGGILGGSATGVAQNLAGNIGQGVRNVARSDVEAAKQAQRIIGRAVQRDAQGFPVGEKLTFPELAARHADFPEGTPLVAAGGPNLIGATRGAYTAPGPGRAVIDKATKDYFEGADTRVDNVLDRISTNPSVPTRVAQLEAEASKAGPLYKTAGVVDDPQTILLRGTNAAGKPTVTSSGLALKSPEMTDFLEASGYAKQAISQARKLSGFKDLPANDMTMVDKVYKHLGGLEQQAVQNGNSQVAREIGNERRKLLDLITKENPDYAVALKTYGDPMKLAEAAKAGEAAAKRNVSPDEMTQIYQGLPDEAHRAEFRGGYASALRGQSDATDRASAAERIWNSTTQREKVNRMVTPTEAGPSNVFRTIDTDLENEKTAARALREVTKGSQTGRVLSELADNAGVDVGSLITDLSNKGMLKTIMDRILASKIGEGRTATVNAEIARIAMETKPAEVARNAHMIERARAAAEQTAAARTAAPLVGGTQGLLSGTPAVQQPGPANIKQPGPADRLVDSLLMR
jgi:hypothetical protein